MCADQNSLKCAMQWCPWRRICIKLCRIRWPLFPLQLCDRDGFPSLDMDKTNSGLVTPLTTGVSPCGESSDHVLVILRLAKYSAKLDLKAGKDRIFRRIQCSRELK